MSIGIITPSYNHLVYIGLGLHVRRRSGRIIISAFLHAAILWVMCGIQFNLESMTTPNIFVSFTLGTLGKCLSGQILSGQMSSGQMSFWGNVFLGKCRLGKCHHGQTSYGQMSLSKCLWANVVWANVLEPIYISSYASAS
jgi:hypothetical protein